MIIFYDKTGKIIGNIAGRIHGEDHLKMWVGKDTERIVCQWERVGDNYKPSIQKEIFTELDRGTKKLKDFKVNTETKELEPIE